MNKNYETLSIEIIEYESDIYTVNLSTIFDFPWLDGNEFYNFFGGTINLSGDTGSTTNIMYNYYAGGINTNVSPTEAGKITTKEALDSAYAAYLASLK